MSTNAIASFTPSPPLTSTLPPYETGRGAITRKRELRDTICQNCECRRDQTNMWRTNPDPPRVLLAEDNKLCNACGLWLKEHGRHRPRDYWHRSSKAGSSSTATERPVFAPRRPPQTLQRRNRVRPSLPRVVQAQSEAGPGQPRLKAEVEGREAADTLVGLGAPTGFEGQQRPQLRRYRSPRRSSDLMLGISPRPAWMFHPLPPQPATQQHIMALPGMLIPRRSISIQELLNPGPPVVIAEDRPRFRYRPYEISALPRPVTENISAPACPRQR
ncbi:uncharacterized protein I303_100563 [Kwoniella dejecticola CBS 10117]|uniref:GATA-type domain-containing protein n=1 Tax=Kwoniella dejecticola CBS 10117 TaxID=1296121 RepID=A0A1A6AF96_9TREE|nr:uncharacterized protein I303_00564 [Kwoniella dejecticola CBS 10117]OBR88747.1 hypothetical protein I303_00564 [Kwoniella dejecticola CBS 10117]